MRSRGKERKLGGSIDEKFPLYCRSGVFLWELGALRDSQREDEEIISLLLFLKDQQHDGSAMPLQLSQVKHGSLILSIGRGDISGSA